MMEAKKKENENKAVNKVEVNQNSGGNYGSKIAFAVIICAIGIVVQIGGGFNLGDNNVPSQGEIRMPMSQKSGSAQAPMQMKQKTAIVEMMPASEKVDYEVSDPTDLAFVDWIGGGNTYQRRERAMGARFRNFYPYDLTLWWDDGTAEGVYSGSIKANGGFSSTNTYTTHRFHFKNKVTGEHVATLTMKDDQHLMLLGPEKDDVNTLNSKGYQDALKEQVFMGEYFQKHGQPWLSHYPRDKPKLFIWPADFVGQTHIVRSYTGYFLNETTQSDQPVELRIKVASTKPKVFIVENLLNEFEIEHIMNLGQKVLKRSSVGNAGDGFESNTRTSENGWLSRHKTSILDSIYHRFGDALQMTQEQLQEGRNGNVEMLQFVRYLKDQKYDNHHDFGNTGKPEQRFSTLLIYLKTPELGGATSFPKAADGKNGGIKVKPPPGSAALFYSMLEDGNGDDLSLHAGMPVEKGVKYVCNLWSWDPKYGS